MPRGDGTGPAGMGPMTGRGAGFCAGFAAPGYANQTGFGGGFGRGRGFKRMFYATGLPGWSRYGAYNAVGANVSEAEEKMLLEKQATLLENQLSDIKKRLAGVEEAAEE